MSLAPRDWKRLYANGEEPLSSMCRNIKLFLYVFINCAKNARGAAAACKCSRISAECKTRENTLCSGNARIAIPSLIPGESNQIWRTDTFTSLTHASHHYKIADYSRSRRGAFPPVRLDRLERGIENGSDMGENEEEKGRLSEK
ncbi:hypothetical protein PUN28_002975 [Cardiocondyla obscurior]|uniref:Uncharacterized protein n=1 Tax=Cardiocondyla obscurior TaxID=286306 RepID=A0AAW2GXA2_9HYME